MRRASVSATGESEIVLPASRKKVYFPLVAAQIYLTMSVLLFAFGPWPWRVSSPFLLYTFLLAFQCALAFGYWIGARRRLKPPRRGFNALRLIRISLITNCIWLLPKFLVRAGISDFSVDAIWNQIRFGLFDPAGAHVAMAETVASGKLVVLYALFTPILFLSIPLAVQHWRRLTATDRFLFAVVVVGEVLSWAATGTSKGVVDSLLVSLAALLPFALSRWETLTGAMKAKYAAWSVIVVVVALTFFMSMQFARRGDNVSLYDRHFNMNLDEENLLVKWGPTQYKAGVGYLLNYLNQGYYAMGLAMDEPFEFTWGIGNSMFWSSLIENVTGVSVEEQTLPARLERHGIDRRVNWHTFYVWFASDLTFPGVVMLMVVVGYYFALSWKSAMNGTNPYGVAVFCLFCVMVAYLPANNQVLSLSPTAVAFPILLTRWRWLGG